MFPRKRKKTIWEKTGFFSQTRSCFRQKKSKWEKRNGRTVLLLSVFLIVYFLFFSPFFLIKEIDVSGNEIISQYDIKNAVRSEIGKSIFGLVPGNNFIFDKGEIIKTVLWNNFSQIKSIEIKKIFPDKIAIKIEEKEPILIWCRTESCFYLDGEGMAILPQNQASKNLQNRKFIKIVEQSIIEEELEEDVNIKAMKEADGGVSDKVLLDDKSQKQNMGENSEQAETKYRMTQNAHSPIKLNEKVSDENFIDFTVAINKELENKTGLKIKYYKTKSVVGKELIAYSDKNTRFYFDASGDASLQVRYLNDFLSKGVGKEKINTLKYVYLMADNKIFYK